jgi:hypothetical protein
LRIFLVNIHKHTISSKSSSRHRFSGVNATTLAELAAEDMEIVPANHHQSHAHFCVRSCDATRSRWKMRAALAAAGDAHAAQGLPLRSFKRLFVTTSL